MLTWSRLSSGPRSIQAPVEQKLPVFDDVNVLTTSGTLPLRIAARILSSTIEPTTLTFTFECFLSYSATRRLNSPSSWVLALQPTHAVMVTGFDEESLDDEELFEPPPKHALEESTVTTTAHAVTTRFMASLLREQTTHLPSGGAGAGCAVPRPPR